MITLSECITRINQVLNYPSVTYTDISHFFDQAISELNTSFRIGLPLVSQMVQERKLNIQELPNLVFLTDAPTGTPEDIPVGNSLSDFTDTSKVYLNLSDYKFYKYNIYQNRWVGYDRMYGVHLNSSNVRLVYETMIVYSDVYSDVYSEKKAVWSPVDEKRLNDFDLNIYMPDDWVILFLIPYVCFKSAVRDGAEGGLYLDEFTQGFQQLQTSYDVPNFVNLSSVAHMSAYTKLAKENLSNLNIKIPTRAVYDSMKVGNVSMPVYGGFHSRGGWGF